MRIYLDTNATAILRPEAKAAAFAAMERVGNASSIHSEGRAARGLIEDARRQFASFVGAQAKDIVFTSGGSEAAATVLSPGFARAGGKPAERLIVSAIEHSCVLAGGRFTKEQISIVSVTSGGVIDLDALAENLEQDPRPALLALMLANNETGIVQPVSEAAALVKAHSGYLVCDAVQAFGKLPFDFLTLGADAVFVSGHKIGALPGVGAIIKHADIAFPALLKGGGQEGDLRAGTENLIAIASFAAAVKVLATHKEQESLKIKALRDFMEEQICTISPKCQIVGRDKLRLGNTSCILVPGKQAETLVIGFDLAGFALGAGSACTSGKLAPSHVLTAMGHSEEEARSALRISLGWSNTDDDVKYFCAEWAKLVSQNGSAAA